MSSFLMLVGILLANEWQKACLNAPQSPTIEKCSKLPLLSLLGKVRIIEILKVMSTYLT